MTDATRTLSLSDLEAEHTAALRRFDGYALADLAAGGKTSARANRAYTLAQDLAGFVTSARRLFAADPAIVSVKLINGWTVTR